MRDHDHVPMTSGPTGTDGYLRDLSAAIPASRRAKREFLREISDGLDDATDALVLRGLDRGAAERAAIREFGSVALLAREYSIELFTLAARRLAIVFAIVFPVVVSAWHVIQTSPHAPSNLVGSPARPDWYAFVDQAEDVVPLIASIGAIAGALLLMRTPLKLVRSELVATILGVWVLIGIVMTATGGAVLSAGSNGSFSHGLSAPVVIVSMLASEAVALALFIPIARSLIRLRRVCRAR